MTNQSNKEENFGDLFTERGLIAVFFKAPTVFANGFNGAVVATVFLALAVEMWFRSHLPPSYFIDTFSVWATIGWTLSSTLLGFLVAGFALLCSVLRPTAIIRLHQFQDQQDDENRLRSLLLSFADIFISYLAMLGFSIGISLITVPHGLCTEITRLLFSYSSDAPHIVGKVIYVLWGTWFSVLVIKLKTFVYNLYQALMIGMVEGAQSYARQRRMEATLEDRAAVVIGRLEELLHIHDER